MSWMQKLYQTYNEVEKSADLLDLDKETLAPLCEAAREKTQRFLR